MQDNFFTSFLIDRTTGKTVSIVEIFDAINGPSADSKVKVTVDDTTTGFLSDKLTAGGGISLNILDSGANETLQIVSDGGKNFEFVVDASGFGGSFTTIQSAITAAEATGKSEAIWVYPGTYTENVTITKTEIGIHGMTLWAQDSTLLIGDLIFNIPTSSTNSINELDVSGSLIVNGTAANLIWVENFDATIGGGASPLVINNTNTSTTIIGHRSRFTETSNLAPAMNAISSGGFDGSDCEFRRNGAAGSNLPAILLGGDATFLVRDTRILGQVDLNSSDNFSLTGGDSQITTSGSADVIENTGHTGAIFVIAATITSLGGGNAITIPSATFFYSRLTIGFGTLFDTNDGTDLGMNNIFLTNDGVATNFLDAQGNYNNVVAGIDTQVQFNDSGVLSGTTNFTFDTVTDLLTTQNLTVIGDAQVNGTLTVVNQVNLAIETGFINMNTGLTVPIAKEGGLVVNYLPTSTDDTVTAGAFTAGVDSVSNPTVVTDTASVFVANDIIQISLTSGDENNGIYEVETHAANLLTIRGIGTISTVETFTNNQFITATDNAVITKINVAILDCHTDGVWHQGQGNQVPVIRTDISTAPAGSNTQIQFNDNGAFGSAPGFTFVESFPDVTMTLSSGLAGNANINFTNSAAALKGFVGYDENIDAMQIKSQGFAELDIQSNASISIIANASGVGILSASSTTSIQTDGPADTTAALRLLNTGTNGGSTNIYSTDRNPTGNISASPGSLAFRSADTDSDLYIHTGSTTNNTDWEVLLHTGTNTLDIDNITFNDGSTQTQGALPNYFQGTLVNAKLNQSINILPQDAVPNGLTFKPDGLKMYIVGNEIDVIEEYDLSIPWDVSTALFLQSFSITTQDVSPQGVEFNIDGSRMYMIGLNTDSVYQYDLSTPYSVISAVVDNAATLNVGVETLIATDIRFRPDGLQIYVTSSTTGIAAYNLTTPFDLATATFSGDFLNTTADVTDIRGLAFRNDGIFMYLSDDIDSSFHQYQLSEPWKILTARHITEIIPSPSVEVTRGIYVSPEAHKFYFVSRDVAITTATVVEFDLGVEFPVITTPLITTSNALVTGNADSLTLLTGTGGTTSGDGGVINITSGAAVGGVSDGGDINFTTGKGFGNAGVAGDINFITGNSGGGNVGLGGGNVNFTLGSNPGDPGANFTVLAGFGGDAGDVSITAGTGGIAGTSLFKGGMGGGPNVGGIATLQGGDGGTTDGVGGTAQILGGIGGGTNGAGGAVTITAAGGLGTSNGGAVTITTGTAGVTTGSGGPVNITTGDASVIGAGGAINLTTGDGGSTGGDAGNITIATGAGIGGDFSAGSITLAAGFSDGSGTGGDIFITGGGGGSTAPGGILSLSSGDGGATSGNGGVLNIESGNAIAGNSSGGEIFIQGGSPNGTGDFGLVSLQLGGGQVGINQSNPNASSILDVVSTTQGFLKPRMTTTQRDAISTPATGLEIFDNTLARPVFFDAVAWRELALKGLNVIPVWEESDFGTVNVGVNIDLIPNVTFELMAPITQTLPFDIPTGASVQFITTSRLVNTLTYTNVSDPQFRGKDIGTFAIFDVIFEGSGTGTLLDIDGGVVSFKFPDFNNYFSIGNVANLVDFFCPGVLWEMIDSGLVMTNLASCTVYAALTLSFDGNSLTAFEVRGERSGQLQFYNNIHESDEFADFLKIDPAYNNNGRVIVRGNSILNSAAELFRTDGTDGAFTVVADASVGVTTINSVSDSSGIARFNFTVGPTIFVNQEVIIDNFTTNTDYNGTFIATTVGIGFFEIARVAFGTDEAGGSFQCLSVTMTDTATTLVEGDTLTIDTDLATDYDGGATVYNQLTNSFQINRTFTVTKTGTWDTSGLDQTDSRVLADNNPNFADSKYIATAFVNNNTDTTTIPTSNTFNDIDFGTLVEGTTIERWKLIDNVNGTFEYTGEEPFSGRITFDFTSISTGGVQDFRFKWEIDTGSGFADLPDAVESLISLGTDSDSFSKTFPLGVVKGDKIKPQVTRNAGSSTITIQYATIYATQ